MVIPSHIDLLNPYIKSANSNSKNMNILTASLTSNYYLELNKQNVC